jgi:hypothetical protein
MNFFSTRQQTLCVLQSMRRDASPKRSAGLHGSACLPAVLVMASCFVAEEAAALAPASRSIDCNDSSMNCGDKALVNALSPDQLEALSENKIPTIQDFSRENKISQEVLKSLE